MNNAHLEYKHIIISINFLSVSLFVSFILVLFLLLLLFF